MLWYSNGTDNNTDENITGIEAMIVSDSWGSGGSRGGMWDASQDPTGVGF